MYKIIDINGQVKKIVLEIAINWNNFKITVSDYIPKRKRKDQSVRYNEIILYINKIQ